MAIIRNQQGEVIAIVCSRPKRCSYCMKPGTQLCDAPKESGGTCDAPICGLHAWHPAGEVEKDYCRAHRRKLEGAEREERRKAELKAKQRNTLIFFSQSKYDGYCREKDCGTRWEQGEPCYWDSKTREVFCQECGQLMASY